MLSSNVIIDPYIIYLAEKMDQNDDVHFEVVVVLDEGDDIIVSKRIQEEQYYTMKKVVVIFKDIKVDVKLNL